MKKIKWYDVPKGAKCYMNSEKGEQIFECLGIDGRYLRWKDKDGDIGIGQLKEYGIDEPYQGMVYEILERLKTENKTILPYYTDTVLCNTNR